MRKINGIECSPRVSEIGHTSVSRKGDGAFRSALDRWLEKRGLAYRRPGDPATRTPAQKAAHRRNLSIDRIRRAELSRTNLSAIRNPKSEIAS